VTKASINPGGATMARISSAKVTMAKAIERYFNVSLYLLVLTGFATLASTGGLDLPAEILVGLALAIRGYQLLTRHEFVIPERWTTILTLIYIFIYFADYLLCRTDFLPPASTWCCSRWWCGCSRCSGRATTTCLRCFVSDGAGGGGAHVGSLFLFSFAFFLLVAVITFVLMKCATRLPANPRTRRILALRIGRASRPTAAWRMDCWRSRPC